MSQRTRAKSRRRTLTEGLCTLGAIFVARRAPAFARQAATWSVLPGTAPLSSQYPGRGNWWGIVGPPAVLSAWNGWAWDQAGETAWLFGCGGHTDYGGNEVYRWRPTEGFARLTEPDPLRGGVREGPALPVDAAGQPVARAPSVHTYSGQIYLDGVVHRFGGSPAWRGGFTKAVWRLDTRTLEHTEASAVEARKVQVPSVVRDATSGLLFLHMIVNTGLVIDTDLAVVARAKLGTWGASTGYAIDEDRRLLVQLFTRKSHAKLHVYDLDDQGLPSGHREVPIDDRLDRRIGRAIAYDPVGRRVIVWLDRVLAFDGAALREIEVANPVPSVKPSFGRGQSGAASG